MNSCRSVFHGLESLQPANCGGFGFDSLLCTRHDHATARGHRQKNDPVTLTGEVECDEVYLVAGHKGQPEIVRELGPPGRRRRLKDKRGRGTLATEKPPVFGMIQCDGDAVLQLLPNVQHITIQPIITTTIQQDTLINTDEYDIYGRLTEWGYPHKTVNHSAGEYARDEDQDGFYKVHVNTMEGFWSLLRSWLRPHRGISQEHLPCYLGFVKFVHNVRRRGKALLGVLLALLLYWSRALTAVLA